MKVLWSIDAFDDLPGLREKTIGILRRFGQETSLEIHPVYVVSPDQLGMRLEFSGASAKLYAEAAKKALDQKLSGIELPGLGQGEVLVHHRPSLKGAVESLAEHAKSSGCDLIVVGSHGRRGLKRLMMGSFAEQLLLSSEVPVFVLGGHSDTQPLSAWDRKPLEILVPNDLSDPKAEVLTAVLDLAMRLHAKAKLLNAIPQPMEQVAQAGVYLLSGGWVPTPIYLKEERVEQQRAADAFLARAKKRDVPCGAEVDYASTSVVESVLKHAAAPQVSFVAMAAESGPIASTLLGSITRQVVRQAPCPVLVFRVQRD